MKNITRTTLLLFLFHASLSAKSISIENPHIKCTLQENVFEIHSKNVDNYSLKVHTNLKLQKYTSESVRHTTRGKGAKITLHNENKTLTAIIFENSPYLYLTGSIQNPSSQEITIRETPLASILSTSQMPLSKQITLGTGGWSRANNPQGSFTYALLADPKSRNSVLVAWLTQYEGLGIIESKGISDTSLEITAKLEFGNRTISAHSSHQTDTLIVAFCEDGRKGLEQYAEQIAETYNIHLPKRPDVYCTWYCRNPKRSGASNEHDLTQNTLFAQQNLHPFGLNAIQIDDEWQSNELDKLPSQQQNNIKLGNGPIKCFSNSNKNFPNGMENMAKTIVDAGFIAGLWFMPFSGDVHNPNFDPDIFAKRIDRTPYEIKRWSGTVIDPTSPTGEKFLRERFRTIYNWGYRYFKIDGLHSGAPSENIYVNRSYNGTPMYGDALIYDRSKSFVEAFRKGLSLFREEAPNAFLLGCAATQNMSSFGPAFGLVHAMRVGPDNDSAAKGVWKTVTRGADYAGNLYFLNNRVWYNDPDPFYVRSSISINKARWMASWQAVSGAMETTSVQYEELPNDRLDIIKRTLPTHTYNARPVDILENPHPQIWKVDNHRMSIIGIFNWDEKKPLNWNYPMSRMDMDDNTDYELFDYWNNKYLGQVKSEIQISVDSASCVVLAIRKSQCRPQLISTSRHITQGLIDVIEENWNEKTKILSGISKMIKGDNYELRIVVPKGFKLHSVKSEGSFISSKKEGKLLRVSLNPKKTGNARWEIIFQR